MNLGLASQSCLQDLLCRLRCKLGVLWLTADDSILLTINDHRSYPGGSSGSDLCRSQR